MTLRDFENGYWYLEQLKVGIPAAKKLRTGQEGARPCLGTWRNRSHQKEKRFSISSSVAICWG
jgi:hypothetical protein